MKDRLVFWGKKNEDQKVLITLDLNEEQGTYDVKIIKGELVTEDFDNLVRNQWRNGSEEVVFPEVENEFTKELTLTQSLLPNEYEVDRDDLLKMAQAEWNFLVLSQKLKTTYQHELSELEEKVDQLQDFSQDIWSDMKTFWNRVQDQIRDKNLARRHGNEIRKRTNELFSTLKEMRQKAEASFNEDSEKLKLQFEEKLNAIRTKMEKGKSLRPLFDELKTIQKEFKKVRLTKSDQNSVWDNLDGLFKEIKEKKFGHRGGSTNSPLEKTERRLDGLNAAIEKMESSISRDKNNLNFESNRIEKAGGQLESQLRQAKLSLIEERIRSKKLKLEDMLKTKKQLEKRILTLQKQAEQEKKEAERKLAEKQVKERIAAEIKETQSAIATDPTVIKAAEMISSNTEEKGVEEKSNIELAAKTISSIVKASK